MDITNYALFFLKTACWLFPVGALLALRPFLPERLSTPIYATPTGIHGLTLWMLIPPHFLYSLSPTQSTTLTAGTVVYLLFRIGDTFGQRPPEVGRRVLRGTKLLSEEELQALAPMNPTRAALRRFLYWGAARVLGGAETEHFLAAGTTGSGKTLLLKLLMANILRGLSRLLDHRAVIYDSKSDLLPFIAHKVCESLVHEGLSTDELVRELLSAKAEGVDPLERLREFLYAPAVIITNPLDDRCWYWQMWKDFHTDALAAECAKILIPEPQREQDPVWRAKARVLLKLLIIVYNNRGMKWTARDLVEGTKSTKRLRALLASDPATKHGVEMFSPTRTYQSVKQILDEAMANLAVPAALWDKVQQDHPERGFSCSEFMNRRGAVLVIGDMKAAQGTLDAVNTLLFQRLSMLALAGRPVESWKPADKRRTFFIIDEASQAGRFAGLVQLLREGRGVGVSVALGIQDVPGFCEVHGGKAAGEEILAMPVHQAFHRIEGPETAEYASRALGDSEFESVYYTLDKDGNLDEHKQIHVGRRVLPSEFMGLPKASPQDGHHAYYKTRGGKFFRNIAWSVLGRAGVFDSLPGYDAFRERPDSDQKLRAWTETELGSLDISEEEEEDPDQIELEFHDEDSPFGGLPVE